MPMCPVVTRGNALIMFNGLDKVIRSANHMIIALEYKQIMTSYMGIVYRTADGLYTGRPQTIDHQSWLYPVIKDVGPLINTSFNNHGQPIVYDMKSVLQAHEFMLKNDPNDRVITIIEV